MPNLAEFTLREKAFNAYWEHNYREAARYYAAAIEAGDKSPDNYYNAACVFSIIGDKDKAFGYLQEAIRLGFREVELLKVDKDLEPIRGDPRWQRVLEKPKP